MYSAVVPISHYIKKYKYINDDAPEQQKNPIQLQVATTVCSFAHKVLRFRLLSILFPQACMALFSAVLPLPANDVDDPDVKAHSSA